MYCKNFRLTVSLIFIAFACISVGGCGGGGSSLHENESTLNNENENANETVIINNELEEGEIPAILEFEGVSEKSYAMDSVISGEIISVPSRTYLEGLKGVRSPDSFVMNLTKGTEYTVEISKGDYYQYEIGYNVPDIEIINPNGKSLSFLDLEESDSLSDDLIELSVYPEENPYIICLTFKPSVTGSYTMNLCQSVSDDIVEDDITLFVYEELRNDDDNTAGYYRRYKFMDKDGNLSSTVNMSDIMALRKAWNDAAENVLEMWDIISDDETLTDEELEKVVMEIPAIQAYLDCVSKVKQYYGIFDDYKESDEYYELNSYETAALNTEVTTAANNDGTKIPAEIYGIPYEGKFTLGNGFFAITGAPAKEYAMNRNSIARGLTAPKNSQRKALFKAGFISSHQDAEDFAPTTLDKAVQLGGFGYSTVYSDSSYCRFGLNSTTFVIHYEETEPVYRTLDDDEDYKLDYEAQDILQNNGSKVFRDEFGDYFVAGFQYGVTYDAFISVTTRTTEQLEKVKTRLPELLSSEGKAKDSNVAKEASEFLRNNEATLTITIRTSGAGTDANVYSTSNMGSVASSLSDAIEKSKKLKPSELVPVFVVLKRYRLLPDVFAKMKQEGDNGLAPISPAHSQKVMNFKRDIVTMHSYFNVILGINMNQEVRNGYGLRYENIRNTVNQQIETFFNESNAANMQKMHNDMLTLTSELKNLEDRYAFYQLLVNAQAEEERRNNNNGLLDRPYGSNGGSIGYQSFMSSTAVQSDINAGDSYEAEIDTFSGSEWRPNFNAGDERVFCYIKVTANNVHDRERKALPPNIGHRTADFYFKCGASRWLEWKINLRSMRLNSKLYPFEGLK